MISDPFDTSLAGTSGRGSATAPFVTLPETADGLLDAAEANLVASRRLAAQRLQLAYAWAAAHEEPATAPMRGTRRGPDGRARRLAYRELGSTGLPVAEDAPAELGISLQTSSASARNLMADAIDLVHRLPRTWTAVQDLHLEAWVARKIIGVTRDLSDEAAGWVDTELADAFDLPVGRLLGLAEAKATAADRTAADTKAEARRRQHTLHLSRETEHGTRSLFARCDAADALRFFQIADHLARLLQEQGSAGDKDADKGPETLDQLRARAIGILANPALALTLLAGITDAPDAEDAASDPGSTSPVAETLLSAPVLARLARAMRAHTDLYVHLTPAMLATGRDDLVGRADLVARAEEIGAVTRDMLVRLLGHEQISLKPVINLADHLTSDRYEVPAAISERLHLAKPHDVFPYGTCLSRRQDQDHSVPFAADRAAAGEHQTHLGNLGHLVRRHHRIKTHGSGWRTWQLDEHTHLWRTPHGRYRITDPTGTHAVEAIDTGPRGAVSPLERRLAALTAA